MSEQNAWQPIETAPKDGTWMLLYAVPNEVSSMRPLIMEGRYGKGLCGGTWLLSHGVGPSFQTTHWMPLPPAPGATS